MRIEEFVLERTQSLHENTVDINMSDSGVHPYDLRTLLRPEELEELAGIELGYGWTNGSPALREAIAALYPGRSADEVVVTNGSAEANFLMVMTLFEPGDELIVVTPNYLQIPGWARAAGVVVKYAPLSPADGWMPDLELIERLVGPRTKAITICNPNNPTGSLMPLERMTSLVALADQHGLYLHADEIYKGSELSGPEGPSFGDLYPKALVSNGLSKAMAMPGLRIGWLLGPREVIALAWHRKDYTSITTGALSEYIGRIVLQPDRRRQVLARSKHILNANLETLSVWVARNAQFAFTPPKAGGMGFLKYAMHVGSTELVERLRIEKSVFPVAGDAFGLDGYIRVGIGAPAEHLSEGLERIEAFVHEHYALPA